MRHPLFLTNLVLLILITSCSEDLYEDATENNRVKTVTIEDVPFLKENINQRRASFKSTSKNAVDYFSLIETQGILLVEKADGSKDYTFALKLPYQDTLTNLIAQEKNNVFTYSLLKYNAENQAAWLQGLEGPNPFAIPVNVTQTDLEGKSLAPSDYCPRLISICPSGLHTLSSYHLCNYYFNEWTFNVVSEPCPIEGGGGDTTPNNGGGSTIGGGSNTSTSPKPCKTCDFNNIDNDPCENLKKNPTKPIANTTPPKTVLDNLNDLKDKMATIPRERLYAMIPTSTNEDQFVEQFENGPLNGDGVEYAAYSNAISIIMHCHYDVNQVSIFSLDDLQQMYFFKSTGNIFKPETYTSYVVTMHGNTYALKFAPQNPNSSYDETYFDDWFIDELDKTTKKSLYELNINAKNSVATNEFNFLHFIRANNLGIEIYKATDNTFTQWSKLTIGPNNQVKPIPCP